MELKARVALVTGASSGVGEAIAEKFAANGYRLVLAARRLEVLEEMASRFRQKYGVQALPVRADLTKYTDITNLFARTRDEFVRLDVLVNVAGSFPKISFVESGVGKFVETYQRSIALMQNAVIYTAKLGLGMLMENGGGVIINVTSDAGLEKKVYPNQLPYLAAKAAVNHATRGMDLELKDKGVRAFALAPGNIDTPLLRKAIEGDPDLTALIEGKIGSLREFYSRILKPSDIADRAFGLAENPGSREESVIEMKSFEF